MKSIGERGQIDSQRLQSILQRTCGGSALFDGRQELIGLANKQRVPFEWGNPVFMPFTAGSHHRTQTIEMRLPADRAPFADNRQSEFVRGLMLIQAVAGHDPAVPSQQVHGVFDGDSFQHLMCGIGHQTLDGAEQPLARVHDVRQRVLNGTAAGCSVLVIDLAIRRAIRREVLAGDGDQLNRLAEATLLNRRSHRGQQRMTSIDIGDSGSEVALSHDLLKSFDACRRSAQRLFDKQVQSSLGELRGDLDMQMRGDSNNGQCRVSRQCFFQTGKSRHSVTLGNRLTQRGIHFDEDRLNPAGCEKAAQMSLAN